MNRAGKIVFVGATHVGKTSIINQYMNGCFGRHSPTTQSACHRKIQPYCGEDIALEIWDTAGQEQYHALGPIYYRDAQVGIVVFDITDRGTFRQCQQWVSELRQARSGIPILVAANKCDLATQRSVGNADYEEFADSVRAQAFETSAKTGANIDVLFGVAVRCIADRDLTVMERTAGRGRKKTSSVQFHSDFAQRHDDCC
jgi:small GTP-binding protein